MKCKNCAGLSGYGESCAQMEQALDDFNDGGWGKRDAMMNITGMICEILFSFFFFFFDEGNTGLDRIKGI